MNNNLLFLQDNYSKTVGGLEQYQKECLREISKINLSDYPIITFPCDEYENETSTKSKSIFKKFSEAKDGTVHIKTGNMVGILSYKDVTVVVTSRFDNDQEYNFMIYLITGAIFGKMNLYTQEQKKGSGSASPFNIFLTIAFVLTWKEAFRQGLYWEYQKYNRNDFNFKGCLDVNRHIKQNIPFTGRIAYSYRIRTYDNPLLWLIRRTIEYLDSCIESNLAWKVFRNQDEIKKMIKDLIEATPGYSAHSFAKIHTSCFKTVRHPLFGSEYDRLRSICLKILKDEFPDLDNTNPEEIWGIVFDMSVIWERFVQNVLLADYNVKKNQRVRLFKLDKKTKNNHYRPDIIIEVNKTVIPTIILDAKYKTYDLDNNEKANRNNKVNNGTEPVKHSEALRYLIENGKEVHPDIHQVTSYLFLQGAKAGGIVFPVRKSVIEHCAEDEPFSYAEYKRLVSTHDPAYFLVMPYIVDNVAGSSHWDKWKCLDESTKWWIRTLRITMNKIELLMSNDSQILQVGDINH